MHAITPPESSTVNGKSRKAIVLYVGVNLCRFLLAATFIFSGFVKAIDPTGFALKLKEYAVAHGIGYDQDSFLFLLPAILLLSAEFLIGASLLLGIRRKIATISAFLLMLFMTPFTLYVALANPVQDCGCFGEAWKITNWQTFYKNVLLLGASVLCMYRPGSMFRFVKQGFQWIPPLYSFLFILAITVYNYAHLPILDFRPYKVGTDLLALRHTLPERGETPTDVDFYDLESFDDLTDSLLTTNEYLFLLIAPRIEDADQNDADLINNLYDYARRHDYAYYGVTASSDAEIEEWRDRTGADYPFLFGDHAMLLSMIRANPGIMLLHKGVVRNKWSHFYIPNATKLDAPLAEDSPLLNPKRPTAVRVGLYAALLYCIPLLLVFLLDNCLLQGLSRLFKRKNKEKTGNEHTEN